MIDINQKLYTDSSISKAEEDVLRLLEQLVKSEKEVKTKDLNLYTLSNISKMANII